MLVRVLFRELLWFMLLHGERVEQRLQFVSAVLVFHIVIYLQVIAYVLFDQFVDLSKNKFSPS